MLVLGQNWVRLFNVRQGGTLFADPGARARIKLYGRPKFALELALLHDFLELYINIVKL